MRPSIRLLLPALVLVAGVAAAASTPAPPAPSLPFAGTEYVLRWSGGHQHEFTPPGQENLETWTDMLTVIHYPDAHDGDALAAVANGVLGNYQGAGATILRTDSVPATTTAPAQHFIAAAFVRSDFAEAAFARFLMTDGIGTAVIHGHRIHGPDAAARMNTWLGENGQAVEDRLMALSRVPTRRELD